MASAPESVECPVCGESFNPDSSAGWCTNPECGEWQWTPEESEAGGGTDEPDPGPAGGEAGGEGEVECPHCESTVPDKAFCLNCGESLEDEEDEEPEPDESPTCPSCGEDVQPDWAACPHCGTSLEGEAAGADEEEGEAETGAAVEAEPSGGADTVPAGGGAEAADHPSGGDETATGAEVPEEVVIGIGDQEITATDGDTVGRKIRSAYVRTGASEEEAQYIHREHVLFEREGGEFYVVNKGRNGTRLNGEDVAVDERQKVAEGDTIEFSDRATGEISLR